MVASVWFSRSIFTFFLGFDRLVQSVGPAAARHQASGELVDDDDFSPSLHHVLDVALVERVRLDGRFDVVLQVPVLRVGDVADAQQLLDLLPAFVGDGDGLVLLVDHVVAGQNLGSPGSVPSISSPCLQLGNDAVHALVLVGRFLAGAADDQRRTRFVDQDGVDFVDDGEVVHRAARNREVELHVVAQVVEAEFVVGAVGDVGARRLRGARRHPDRGR